MILLSIFFCIQVKQDQEGKAESLRRVSATMLKVPQHLSAGLDNFKDTITSRADGIMNEVFPKKIMKLNELYSDLVGKRSEIRQMKTGSKPGALNMTVKVLFDRMKREIIELCEVLNVLEVWLQLQVPKISDGGNFGVEIQEEILAMLHHGRRSGLAVLDAITKYFFKRGKIVSDKEKYAGIDDLGECVAELDQRQYSSLLQSACDLRNNYAILYDKLHKNRSKLSKPRNQEGPPLMLY